MKHIFVDTSGWDALADKADKDHAKALQFRDEIAGNCKLVTSNYIILPNEAGMYLNGTTLIKNGHLLTVPLML